MLLLLELGSEAYISSSVSETWAIRPNCLRAVEIMAACGTGTGILVLVSIALYPTTSSMTQLYGAHGPGSRGFLTLMSSATTLHTWQRCKFKSNGTLVQLEILIPDSI